MPSPLLPIPIRFVAEDTTQIKATRGPVDGSVQENKVAIMLTTGSVYVWYSDSEEADDGDKWLEPYAGGTGRWKKDHVFEPIEDLVKMDIDLAGDSYSINKTGMFGIIDASANDIRFPDPVNFEGKTITVINFDPYNNAVIYDEFRPYHGGGSSSTDNIERGSAYTIKSIGSKWIIVSRNAT